MAIALAPRSKVFVSARRPSARIVGAARPPARPARIPRAFTEERAGGGSAGTEFPVDAFVRGKPWAEAAVQLQREVVHALVDEHLGPLQPQPTKHAADGVLRVQGPEGKVSAKFSTHSGGAVWHMCTTNGATPAFNMIYTKTSVFACTDLLTPFLDVEVGGSDKSLLLAIFFSPRLSLLRHLDYTRKYYRTVPPGSSGLSDFSTLYNRMLDRAQSSMGVVTATHNSGAPDAAAAPPPLYHVFTSKQLWTRLNGHGAMFRFDPQDAQAWEAVRRDTGDLVRLWCAWAGADWEAAQGGAGGEEEEAVLVRPTPKVVEEWRELSRLLLDGIDQDEESASAEAMLGKDNFIKMKATGNGRASLAPPPGWRI